MTELTTSDGLHRTRLLARTRSRIPRPAGRVSRVMAYPFGEKLALARTSAFDEAVAHRRRMQAHARTWTNASSFPPHHCSLVGAPSELRDASAHAKQMRQSIQSSGAHYHFECSSDRGAGAGQVFQPRKISSDDQMTINIEVRHHKHLSHASDLAHTCFDAPDGT